MRASTCAGRDKLPESVLCVLPPGFGLQFSGLATSSWTPSLSPALTSVFEKCWRGCYSLSFGVSQRLSIASEETMYGRLLDGRCFLELWVSSPVSSLTFSLWPVHWRERASEACFSLPANHYSATICCLYSEPLFLPAGLTFSHSSPLQLSLTSPLGLSLQAERSLLPVLFRVPLRGISRSVIPRQSLSLCRRRGDPGGCVHLGLVCFRSRSYFMYVCLGNLIHLTQIITRDGLPCYLGVTVWPFLVLLQYLLWLLLLFSFMATGLSLLQYFDSLLIVFVFS